ncbi:hypothetical protein H0H92_002312 [Tricholoma furcatifolium]|nr:hypothetical protein H0H92_002312 [Tricholoma furcatifolium]
MDDSFQFIIESPQHSQSHRKRPRLVTSCDNWKDTNPALDAFSVASGPSSPALSSHSNNRSTSHSPKPSGVVSPNPDARYTTYPPDSRRPGDPSHRSPLYQQSSRHLHLFDPEQPQNPNPQLLSTLVQIFFEHVGSEFPFLVYEQISQDVWDRRLPPMVSNVIAAIASRSVPSTSRRPADD